MSLVFDVAVRNELTGEMGTIAMATGTARDAQTAALIYFFKSRGWRKAVALIPPPGHPADPTTEGS